jgi:ABC-type transporter Mla subunit MlaD
MPSPSERHRNNIRAGVFVTISIILGLVVFILLTDAIEKLKRRTHDYIVTFSVESGVPNLQEGSTVKVGGLQMGSVKEVRPVLVEGQPFREIEVEFSIDRQVELYNDARIVVSGPLIGAESWLDIPDVGNAGAGEPPDQRLRGVQSVGLLTTLLGSENAETASTIVDDAAAIVSDARTRWPQWGTRLDTITANTESITGNVNSVTADLREQRWPNWADRVDQIMQGAVDLRQRLKDSVDQAYNLLTDGRDVVAENRPGVKAAIDNVQAVTDRFNNETMNKVTALLDSGQAGLDHATAVLGDLKVDYSGWSTNVGEALARANIAAQQLKLATIEVRRSPWKLLYRPSSEELEHELLYESTRSFAVAAADLKSCADSVERVLTNYGGQLGGNEESYRRLEKLLLNSLDNYEKAQQQMLDVIIADSPK